LDSIIKKGRPQILDVVRAYDPRSTNLVHRANATGRVEVANGDVNHPSQVGDVVDVPVPIDRFLWNIELVPKDTFCARASHAVYPKGATLVDPANLQEPNRLLPQKSLRR